MTSLKPEARSFAGAVLSRLRPLESAYGETHDWTEAWQRTEGTPNQFIRRRRVRHRFEACLVGELDGLLAETGPLAVRVARFRRAVSHDSRFAPFLGHLVGTPLSARPVDESSVASSLTWHVARAANGFRFSNDAFEIGYAAWLREHAATSQQSIAVSPISGLNFSGTVRLDANTEITQLSDSEVSACLSLGYISAGPMFAHGFATVTRAGVRSRIDLPRGLFDEFTDEDRQRAQSRSTEAIEKAREAAVALRMFCGGHATVTGHVTILGDGSMNFLPESSPPSPFTTPNPSTLDTRSTRKFADFWAQYRSASKNRVLGFALRRFSFAGERTRDDDRIVDLVSALEALLLKDDEGSSDLRYRTALRGAVLDASGHLTREQVQERLQAAYRVRSAVAHGRQPKPSQLTSVDGTRVSFTEFVREVEDVARAVLAAAVRSVGAGHAWPPGWDQLILGRQRFVGRATRR